MSPVNSAARLVSARYVVLVAAIILTLSHLSLAAAASAEAVRKGKRAHDSTPPDSAFFPMAFPDSGSDPTGSQMMWRRFSIKKGKHYEFGSLFKSRNPRGHVTVAPPPTGCGVVTDPVITSRAHRCRAAINAGFFNITTLSCINGVVADGRVANPIDRHNTYFGVTTNGYFFFGFLDGFEDRLPAEMYDPDAIAAAQKEKTAQARRERNYIKEFTSRYSTDLAAGNSSSSTSGRGPQGLKDKLAKQLKLAKRHPNASPNFTPYDPEDQFISPLSPADFKWKPSWFHTLSDPTQYYFRHLGSKGTRLRMEMAGDPDWRFSQLVAGAVWLVHEGKIVCNDEDDCGAGEDMSIHTSGEGFVTDNSGRAAIAVTKHGEFIMFAVDGKTGTGSGTSLPEFARALAELGAYYAINLDGGGSTTALWDSIVVNSVSDTGSACPGGIDITPGPEPNPEFNLTKAERRAGWMPAHAHIPKKKWATELTCTRPITSVICVHDDAPDA